ncbi:MAG: hypothetical protein K0U98_19980 [Deltaproteobacteria bacterium]|nr:hypothetical protein [Deltaproteobacteria bacterium]
MKDDAASLPPHSPPAWKKVLGYGGGAFLGLVLLVAAWAKLLDPDAFVEQIHLEGLDFLLSAKAVAFIALALEVGLGMALLLGIRRLWVLVPSSFLVAFFLWLTGRNFWLTARGLREEGTSCGCFGSLVERTASEAFWQDILLLVPALLLAFLARRWGSTAWLAPRWAVVGLATALSLFVAWKSPQLPLDNLATRLKPGAQVGQLCAGPEGESICLVTMVPEFAQGSYLVVLADLQDPAFGESVERLNSYVASGPELPLWVLSDDSLEEQQAFFWQFAPRFEIRSIPEELIHLFYRRLPRSFTLEEGAVVSTFSGLPPLDDFSGDPALAAAQ